MERWTGIVADTDGASASILRKTLRKLRCDVVTAPSPEAIDVATTEHKTAVLLVAASLPGLDARRLCQQLHAAPGRSYYVISMLERHAAETVTAAFEAGADEVLRKPLIAAEVRARLEQAKRVLRLETLRTAVESEGAWLAEIAATRSIYSPRYLHGQLENEVARSQRFAHSLAVILADVHHDDARVVRKFGHLLSVQLRAHVDWAGHYGERRIALVLPETNLGGALRVAERLHERLNDGALASAGLPTGMSAGFGISALGSGSTVNAQALLDAAEGYLDDAFRKGANQIAGGPAPRSQPRGK
jgi:diguanylate cyclase (GGDEF)-like protein